MGEPLLSSLCSICHIHVPKYTCPRCSVETCSLPCSRRHKLWSSCNGLRDPTVFKPRSELATPSGIDHDYNFLHSIEHKIERSEKAIIEDRHLVERDELAVARNGEAVMRRHGYRYGKKNEVAGEAPIQTFCAAMGIQVHRAPKGMARSLQNGTNWSRHQRTINWQVEWIKVGDSGRFLAKAMGNKPLAESYLERYEEERKKGMSEEERRTEKKRKWAEVKRRAVKRVRLEDRNNRDLTTAPRLQDPKSGSWNFPPANTTIPGTEMSGEDEEKQMPTLGQKFYLHRPHTPSSFGKVLVPLSPSKHLSDQLRKRAILEFPTIYVLEKGTKIPDGFTLENDFLVATGKEPLETLDMESEVDDESSSDEQDEEEKAGASTSGSDSSDDDEDENVKDREIA